MSAVNQSHLSVEVSPENGQHFERGAASVAAPGQRHRDRATNAQARELLGAPGDRGEAGLLIPAPLRVPRQQGFDREEYKTPMLIDEHRGIRAGEFAPPPIPLREFAPPESGLESGAGTHVVAHGMLAPPYIGGYYHPKPETMAPPEVPFLHFHDTFILAENPKVAS